MHDAPAFKLHDHEPQGWLDYDEWYQTQVEGGLLAVECPTCCRWKFPQDFSTRQVSWTTREARGRVVRHTACQCLACARDDGRVADERQKEMWT